MLKNMIAPCFVLLILTGVLWNHLSSNSLTNALKAKGVITKVELKIVSDAGVKRVVLTDARLLDSINTALQQATSTDANQGGTHDIWADTQVYKNGKKLDVWIQHSPYYGWMIALGNQSLSSDYIFNLIKRYSK